MSVLLEALSVVLHNKTLDALDDTASDLYGRIIANDTFRADGRLAAAGLVLEDDDGFVDIAIIDQARGPTRDCAWLDCYAHDNGYALACPAGEPPGDMIAYEGWSPDERPELEFIAAADMGERLHFLRLEGNRDVFLDRDRGQEVFIERPD